MSNDKIAIVCSGGGMRCAYSAGALIALAEEFDLTKPDILIATSGSAGSSLYYLTGQYDDIKTIWTELLSTRKFISFFRFWRIMDIDYLIDEVFKKQCPLQVELLPQVNTNFYIPITDTVTKKARYISKEDKVDIFEALRATKAIPLLFGKSVSIDNNNYIDGVVGVSFEDTVKKAKELGATTIIAIDNSKHPKTPAMVESGTEIIYISNSVMPANRLTRSSEKLRETLLLGYRDIANNNRLQEIFKN